MNNAARVESKVTTVDAVEGRSVGIVREGIKVWLAMTLTQSKRFATYRGAEMWLLRRGYDANGQRRGA